MSTTISTQTFIATQQNIYCKKKKKVQQEMNLNFQSSQNQMFTLPTVS